MLLVLLLRIPKMIENSIMRRVSMAVVLCVIYYVYEEVIIRMIRIKMPWFKPSLIPPKFMF